MNRFLKTLAVASIAALPTNALSAGGAGYVEDYAFSFEGPFGSFDRLQLQRGFQVFQEVCSACHGLKYVSFRELGDPTGPAFPEEQVKAIASQYFCVDKNPEIGDRECKPSDKFPENNGAGAPDLSLMAKARAGFHGPSGLGINQFLKGIGGPEYIASLLTGYTGEEKEQAGTFLYENTAYGGYLSMSQPLWGDDVEYQLYNEDGSLYESEGGATIPIPEATIEQQAKDVAAFLTWAAEPKMVERKQAGLRNILMLVVLAVLLYYTNKKLWAPIKRKEP